MSTLISCSQQQAVDNGNPEFASQTYGDDDDGVEASTSKVFNDPVHGHFRLEGPCIAFIDTREFQRLRWLKQLGLAYHIFPGASHNRFEHSLGVAWQAHKLAKRLYDLQGVALGMDPIDATLVCLAGDGWLWELLASDAGVMHDVKCYPCGHNSLSSTECVFLLASCNTPQ